MSFEAAPADGAVQLSWRTGSELDNLGFHLYRGPSAEGPWTRLTAALIPGLGSSPLGQAYVWRDGGLVNGQRYYYRLEDVDASTKSTFHGPVSAVPESAVPAPPPGGGGSSGGSGSGSGSGATSPAGPCPAWVLSAYAQAAPAGGGANVNCAAYGKPEAVSLRELRRDARGATLELSTGGFYAVKEPSGTVRVFLPGFDFSSDPTAPALPVRRALVGAEVGRKVRLVSAEADDLRGFAGLRPSAVGRAQLEVSRDGSVVPGRRARRRAAALAGIPAAVRGAALGSGVPGGREERGGRDQSRALRRLPPAARAGPEGDRAAGVHGGRGGRGRVRPHRAAGAAPPVGGARDDGSALHQPDGSPRGGLRGALPGPPAGAVRLRPEPAEAGRARRLPRGAGHRRLRAGQRAVLPRRPRGALDRVLGGDGVGAGAFHVGAADGGGAGTPVRSGPHLGVGQPRRLRDEPDPPAGAARGGGPVAVGADPVRVRGGEGLLRSAAWTASRRSRRSSWCLCRGLPTRWTTRRITT